MTVAARFSESFGTISKWNNYSQPISAEYGELMGTVNATSVVNTTAANDSYLVTLTATPDVDAWKEWIDKLLDWWKNPAEMDSDDGVSTSRDVIESAIRFAYRLSKTPMPAPVAVVPDGNGGITFQFRVGRTQWRFEFLRTRHIDLYQFQNGDLIASFRLR